MKEFKTSKGEVFNVDDQDIDIVGHWAWRVNPAGYVQRTTRESGSQTTYLLHRKIWEKHHGVIPVRLEIDHKDANKLNNSLSNFELVTKRENIVRSKPNQFGYPGVTKAYDKPRSKPYRARIRLDKQNKWLGYFATPEEAYQAYLKAVKDLET